MILCVVKFEKRWLVEILRYIFSDSLIHSCCLNWLLNTQHDRASGEQVWAEKILAQFLRNYHNLPDCSSVVHGSPIPSTPTLCYRGNLRTDLRSLEAQYLVMYRFPRWTVANLGDIIAAVRVHETQVYRSKPWSSLTQHCSNNTFRRNGVDHKLWTAFKMQKNDFSRL